MANMDFFDRITRGAVLLSAIMLCGCEGLAVHDTASLLAPRFQRSERFARRERDQSMATR
jgi:hypothetical protein